MSAISSGYFSLSCYFLISLLFLILGQIVAEKQLQFVILIYRHGDRSPVHTYINDPYQESSWPDGFGQLTKDGMQQQYDLGQYLRKRYAGFLNETYNRHEVYVRSSDLDRTLMSAQANLAGLFPPDKEQLWNPNILWQPIPVHTVPQSNENLIRLPFTKCPRYIELQNSTYTSEEYQRRIEPYEDFLKNLSINTGHTVEDLKRKYAWTTYDALYCESIHNYPLPPWVTAETMTALNQLSDIGLESLYGVYKQDEKSRLQGGVLLNSVIKNFTNFMANSTSKEKLIMYSAHDTTVAAVQMAMNVYNGKIPPYAACHIFELHMEENGLQWRTDRCCGVFNDIELCLAVSSLWETLQDWKLCNNGGDSLMCPEIPYIPPKLTTKSVNKEKYNSADIEINFKCVSFFIYCLQGLWWRTKSEKKASTL
uniref:acid phosphatase n=1 Tax=Leptobrachium leishanense TaxID=445787 RepID=A0A8C5PVJ6_9ANUR